MRKAERQWPSGRAMLGGPALRTVGVCAPEETVEISALPGEARGVTGHALPHTAYLALGSNLGDSKSIIGEAFERLAALSAQPIRRSSLWSTSPVDCPPGSPPFVNAAVALEPLPGETPESLLVKLQAIEGEFGRRPKAVPNEPRPLDLDLIAWGTETRRTASLTLPHPRALQRQFVLRPLAEIAGDFVFPGETRSVRAILAELRTDELIERITQ